MESWKIASGQSRFLNATATDYSDLGGGMLKPSHDYRTSILPLVKSESFNNAVFLDPAYAFIPVNNYNSYDNSGRLIDCNIQNRGAESIIYDISDNIVAHGLNATSDKIGFKSFEPGESDKWTFTPSGVTIADSKTGLYSYVGQLTVPVVAPGNFIINFFAKGSGTISVASVNQAVTGNWVFYSIPVSSTGSVAINTNGNYIDEISVMPAGARLSTYTYQAGVGMTSDDNDNGQVKKYSYDAFSRLSVVRDKEENIIRRYQYSSKKFLNVSLSTTYSNYLCTGANTIPGAPVTYTVPVGRYVSLISQADADYKAAMDTALNGKYYADTHGNCIAVFYNVMKSNYFSKQGCSYYTVPVQYVVPAKKYYSTVSQDDANAKAQADLDANGQAYANANGICRTAITLTYQNIPAFRQGFHVYLNSNNGDNANYEFVMTAKSGTLGTVPNGSYNIQISAPAGNTNTYSFTAGCAGGVAGTSAYFSNVTISDGCAMMTIN
jgi:YD repeat-containing protein